MSAPVTIDPRFRGPPDSANGGYACGMAAREIRGPAEVTLRLPPPLDEPLRLERSEAGSVLLDEAGALIAAATSTTVQLDVPDPVSLDEAGRAAERYPWRDAHPYPTCFVCGPARDAGDGLGIFPGPIDDGSLFAAPWTAAGEFADEKGEVRDEFVWAALDCPSGIVTGLLGDVGRILLGRLAADILRPVAAGTPLIVQAWPVGRDGRKLKTASALFTADGELAAVARAVWIEVAE